MTPFGVAPRMAGSRFFAAAASFVPRERVRPAPRLPLPLPPPPEPMAEPFAPIPSLVKPRQWEAAISGSQFRVHSSSLDSATLVWRRERPLAVGDRVRSVLWPADATPRTIVFIEGDEAILSTGDRLSGPHSITSLRRADA